MRTVQLQDSWRALLADQFEQPYMQQLREFLLAEKRARHQVYPAGKDMFAALNLVPLEQTKVVIIGQDPYHGPGQAHGLSFSVETNVPSPPSLKNIYKELHADLGLPPASHGNLSAWARQGVLLLNSCLTVEDARAGSHQNKGWEPFTDAVMDVLNTERSNIVFILWGRKAMQKGHFIDQEKHLVITSAHPSPLSAHNGFFGSNPFSRANAYLARNHVGPIDWYLN